MAASFQNKLNLTDKAVRFLIYAAILLVPVFFLPFTQNLLFLDKQIVLTSLIFLSAAIWLVGFLAKTRSVLVRNKTSFILLALTAFVFISYLLSGAARIGFFGNSGGEADAFVNILSFSLLFFLITAAFRQPEDFYRLLYTFFISSAAVLFIGVLQIFGIYLFPWDFTQNVAFNTIGTTNALAVYLGAFFSVSLAYLLFAGRNLVWWLILFVCAIAFLTTVLIGFWPVFLGYIKISLVLLLSGFQLKKKFTQKSLIAFLLALFSVFFILTKLSVLPVNLPVLNLPPEVAPSLDSSWQLSLKTFQGSVKNLFFGSGPATYQYQYSLYRDQSLNNTLFWNIRFNQGINALFTHLVEWGALGLILLLIFIGAIKLSIFKNIKLASKKYGGIFWPVVSGVAFLFLMLFFYPQNFSVYFIVFVFSALIIGVAALAGNGYAVIALKGSYKNIAALIALLAIVLLGFAYYFIARHYVAAVYFNNGFKLANAGEDLEKAMPYIQKSVKLDPQNDNYLRAASAFYLLRVNNLALRGLTSQEAQQNLAQELSFAAQSAKKATEVNPKNPQNWLNLARLYETTAPLVSGSTELSFSAYKKAAELDPLNPEIYQNLGRAYLASANRLSQSGANLKSINEARDLALLNLRKSLELKADYAPSYLSLIQALYQQGNNIQAENQVRVMKSLFPGDLELSLRLGLVYYQLGQLDKAREELELTLAFVSDYSDARYLLGLVYDKQGEKEKGLEQFEFIKQLNPGNAEVLRIIQNIKGGNPALDGILPLF